MNIAQKLPIAKTFDLFRGTRNDNPQDWTSFGWEDPIHGSQVKGELIVIRPEGSSGSLSAGLWRTSPLAAGCRADGSSTVVYSAPVGDETVFILEGEAVITVKKTGKKHHIKAGDVMSHPKGLDVTWEISGPFLKKFWVIWDSPHAAKPADDLYVGNGTGEQNSWVPFEWDEPLHGPSKEGEIQVIRDVGATGTLMCGLWRTGMSSPVRNADGSSEVKYSSPLGDETALLLEGEAVLTVVQTGKQHHIKAGDIVGHPKNLEVLWSIKTPFLKKFWVITDADLPTT
ncbi:cupin domain-containing protein [Nevskia ramosa]|uniref:cupin domain-containing protein n=1 Tax=Nevskia ramosa TaxID=64002 RepID=UPI003D0B0321